MTDHRTPEELNREQRDREATRSAGRKISGAFFAKVVGVSFVPGYPDNLTRLDKLMRPQLPDGPGMLNGDQAQLEADLEYEHALDDYVSALTRSAEPLAAVLLRNPDNEYDSNAIQVHVPALGEEWGMIGHLTRPIAARLAPEMDDDIHWMAEVETVLINPDHPDRPGISIKCARVGEEE